MNHHFTPYVVDKYRCEDHVSKVDLTSVGNNLRRWILIDTDNWKSLQTYRFAIYPNICIAEGS